jgi:hypothetical protein
MIIQREYKVEIKRIKLNSQKNRNQEKKGYTSDELQLKIKLNNF